MGAGVYFDLLHCLSVKGGVGRREYWENEDERLSERAHSEGGREEERIRASVHELSVPE